MTSSGSYSYNPSLGDLTIYAYQLCGIRPTEIIQEHITTARTATNMMLARWANQGVNLWEVDLITVVFAQTPTVLTVTGDGTTTTLTYASLNTPVYAIGAEINVAGTNVVDGSQTVTASAPGSVSFLSSYSGAATGGTISSDTPAATYSVNPNTVMILDTYCTTTTGSSNIDRIILPVSRTEYASYPNKEQVGFPTVYWFDRLLAPTVTLWPSPDGTSSQQFSYYRVHQIQDANMTGGQTLDIPYLWMEAFAFGLAVRLAQIWAPAMAVSLKAMADESYQIAAAQNTEYVQQYISPQISGYFR